jgi:hypothetical protein
MKKRLLAGLLLVGSITLVGCVAEVQPESPGEVATSTPEESTPEEAVYTDIAALEKMPPEDFMSTAPTSYVPEDSAALLKVLRSSKDKYEEEGYSEELIANGIESYTLRYHSPREGAPVSLSVGFDPEGQPNNQNINTSEEDISFLLINVYQIVEFSSANALAKVSDSVYAVKINYRDDNDIEIAALYYVEITDEIVTKIVFSSNNTDSIVVSAELEYGENAVAEEILRTLDQ